MKAKFLIIQLCLFLQFSGMNAWCINSNTATSGIEPSLNCPFSTDSSHLTVWNGERYVPFFIKGINLGIAVPGTSPGELAASRSDYARWFTQIKAAGYNCIRVYTLHYPHFYEELDSFNRANPNNPLYFFQGIWLEEELPGYNRDMYFLSSVFQKEIEEDIDCVHGNRVIGHRYGKAYGTYGKDASRWLIGYVLGREVAPDEILMTDSCHSKQTSYQGRYLSISHVKGSEVFVTQKMDSALIYEATRYQEQHPVTFSGWPTLDPFHHPSETTTTEDVATLDLSRLDLSKAKAGVFISYHAYPYYPDFISKESAYQSCWDEDGQNSYLCYLRALRRYYSSMPVVIAEVGVPSSWGVAHYAQSGMNHGGETELQQGQYDLRVLKNISESGCAGGIQFAWMDEWFKRTWITDPIDFPLESRMLWQNVCSAEQNFGLIGFRKKNRELLHWQTFGANSPVRELKGGADYAFFTMQMKLNQPFNDLDTLWIALDTYDSYLGERATPEGDTLAHGAEFLLRVTNDAADLFVTEAYDLFKIWFKTADPVQLFHSIATLGRPWKLVRWQNNEVADNIQYIGHLSVNRLGLPASSKDAVTFSGDSVTVRLPWSLLHFVDPSKKKVMNDDRSTPDITELRVSDGILPSVKYKGKWITPDSRFTWNDWSDCVGVEEYPKASYVYLKQHLGELPGMLVALTDSFSMEMNGKAVIDPPGGVLKNDLIVEPGQAEVVLAKSPGHGVIQLTADGGFTYVPDWDFYGDDHFTYKVLTGMNQSDTATVALHVLQNRSKVGFAEVYPNPAKETVHVISPSILDEIILYNASLLKIRQYSIHARNFNIDVSGLMSGFYFLEIHAGNEVLQRKVVVVK